MREELGVTAPRKSCRGKRFLIDWRCGDGVDPAGLCVRRCRDDRVVRGPASCRLHATSRKSCDLFVGRWTVENDVADRGHPLVGGGLQRDFGTNAGRIADGDTDPRTFAHPHFPQPPEPQVPQPPLTPGPVGLLQDPHPPSSAQPPCFTPFPFGSS